MFAEIIDGEADPEATQLKHLLNCARPRVGKCAFSQFER